MIAVLAVTKTNETSANVRCAVGDWCSDYPTSEYCTKWNPCEGNTSQKCCDEYYRGPFMDDCCRSHGYTSAADLADCMTLSQNTGAKLNSPCIPAAGSDEGGDIYEVSLTCSDGEYVSYTNEQCETCPAHGERLQYRAFSIYANDEFNFMSDKTGDEIEFCYIPQGQLFSDTSGTYQYIKNCFYANGGSD